MTQKILLINPPEPKRKGNIWRKITSCMPPLGLGYLAGLLEHNDFPVEILDANALQLSLADVKKILSDKKPSVIGITATTFVINNALVIAQIAKNVLPNSLIILGGVHPTVLPDEVLNHNFVDIVVRGEGEYTLLEIVQDKSLKEILGLSYKTDGQIIHNPDRPLIDQLDSLPSIAYHLLPMHKYYPALGGYQRLPAISMLTSRGCPGHCTFCYKSMFGTKVRAHSAERLINEIGFLQRKYGIREVVFYDDTFTAHKENIINFCHLLLEKKINLTWSCMSRVDSVDLGILTLMKKAGCHQICYGLESGDQAILKSIAKNTSLDKAKEVCRLTKQTGINLRLAFMFGNPGETLTTMESTIKLAVSLEPDFIIFNITTPYPGTAMFKWAKRHDYLKSYHWPDYNLAKMIMELPTIKSEVVEKYYRWAYRRFYLRPFYLLKRLLKIKSWHDISLNLQGLLSIIPLSSKGE